MSKTKYLKTFFILSLLFVFQTFAFAQDTIPTQIPDLDEQIDVTLDPSFPQPGEPITVTLDAYGVDLDNSNISWTANGTTILEGKGQKVLKTTAGKSGQITTIKAAIDAPNSKEVIKTVTINPQSVDIIWEADTYTPPFYKGKALFSAEEKVTFVAMPNQTSAKNTIYKWSQDGEVLKDQSGFGKNTLPYEGDILAGQVDVSVETTDGTQNTASNNISIAPTKPEVYMYEKNPLYGTLFNKELSTLFDLGTNQEGTLSIYPFFYGVTNRGDSKLTYNWSINNNPIEVPTTQNDMTFRNTTNVDGKSAINIDVINTDNSFEDVSKGTLINFNKPGNPLSF
ncbi:MAG: hypothetical protein V4469_03705 [Patescibacteria group bacterium]